MQYATVAYDDDKIGELKSRFSRLFHVSPLQLDLDLSESATGGVEADIRIKVIDAEDGTNMLSTIDTSTGRWEGISALGVKVETPTLTGVHTASAKEIDKCDFHVVRADVLRDEATPRLSGKCHQQMKREHPGFLEKMEVAMDCVLAHSYADNILVVSHRWEQPGNPDPDGVQEELLRNFLRRPGLEKIKYVWHDYWCLPQRSGGELSDEETAEFRRMLTAVNLVYLGATVLILLDGTRPRMKLRDLAAHATHVLDSRFWQTTTCSASGRRSRRGCPCKSAARPGFSRPSQPRLSTAATSCFSPGRSRRRLAHCATCGLRLPSRRLARGWATRRSR